LVPQFRRALEIAVVSCGVRPRHQRTDVLLLLRRQPRRPQRRRCRRVRQRRHHQQPHHARRRCCPHRSPSFARTPNATPSTTSAPASFSPSHNGLSNGSFGRGASSVRLTPPAPLVSVHSPSLTYTTSAA